MPSKMLWASNFVDLSGKYIWAMSNVDLDAAKEIELTNIKKYWRYARQVEIELD